MSNEDLGRYARHIALAEIGRKGQERISASKVLVAGLGGLGSAASLYLAAGGVGFLGLVDFDTVEPGNMLRQVLHGTEWVGKPKVDSALSRLRSVNPRVELTGINRKLTAENALEILEGYDVIVDALDTMTDRYVLNEACQSAGKPLVHGSVSGWEGEVSVFLPGNGPCLRCLYPSADGKTEEVSGGVFGPLAGITGTIQAGECLKLLSGTGTPLAGRLLRIDALNSTCREFRLGRDPDCPCCGKGRGG